MRPRRCRRPRAYSAKTAGKEHGWAMGVSGRKDRSRRTAGGDGDPRAQGGAGDRREGSVSGAAYFRLAQLSGVSAADAALYLSAMGRNRDTARGTGDQMGEAARSLFVSDAPGGSSACSRAAGSVVRRFLSDERGATAIEYAII